MRLHAAGRIGGYVVRCHGPDVLGQRVKVGGKTVCFDFDERFGPLVVDRYGEPLDRQPVSEQAAFWAPFEAWLSGYWRAKQDRTLDAYLTANHGTQERRELRYPGRSHPNKRASIPSGEDASTSALSTDEQEQPNPIPRSGDA